MLFVILWRGGCKGASWHTESGGIGPGNGAGVELEAAGDFTLRVARSFAGCEARLVEAGSWHPVWAARLPGVPAFGRQGRVDSSGLLPFTGIPSGLYDLVLDPPAVPEQVAGSRPAQAIFRDLVVSAQARGPGALAISPLLGSGVLSARLSLGAEWRRRSWRHLDELELVVDAVGRRHWAEASFPLQALLQDQESGVAGLERGSAQLAEPGRFTFTGLAGGEYRLYLTLRLRERLRYLLGAPSAPAQLVRALSLQEGEGMVLGAIEPALPQAFSDFLEQVKREALLRALGPPCGQDRP
jgi:hypothetical protein